jgi:predicted nucleic acid-binding protein
LAVTLNAGYLLADDKALRRAAQLHKLTLIGTGGLLVRFKQLGYIRSVQRMLEEVVELGLRLDKRTQALILKAAGE